MDTVYEVTEDKLFIYAMRKDGVWVKYAEIDVEPNENFHWPFLIRIEGE